MNRQQRAPSPVWKSFFYQNSPVSHFHWFALKSPSKMIHEVLAIDWLVYSSSTFTLGVRITMCSWLLLHQLIIFAFWAALPHRKACRSKTPEKDVGTFLADLAGEHAVAFTCPFIHPGLIEDALLPSFDQLQQVQVWLCERRTLEQTTWNFHTTAVDYSRTQDKQATPPRSQTCFCPHCKGSCLKFALYWATDVIWLTKKRVCWF